MIDTLRTRQGIEEQSATVTITRRELAHGGRPDKQARGAALTEADLDRLPTIFHQPKAVLYDTTPGGKDDSYVLLYVFDSVSRATPGKAVMELNFSDRLKIGEAPRQRLTTHSVRTLGYVETGDLRDPRYMLLEGSLD